MAENIYFCLSNLDIKNHSFLSGKMKLNYCLALKILVEKTGNNKYYNYKIQQYFKSILGRNASDFENSVHDEKCIFSKVFKNFWDKKSKYLFICDIAGIFIQKDAVENALTYLQNYTNKKTRLFMASILSAIYDGNSLLPKLSYLQDSVDQCRKNYLFSIKSKKKFVVTANMSAGKSTLINALIGKKITRTSQEVCTGNISYIYNKPFEDGKIHLENGNVLNMDANRNELTTLSWENPVKIASYFQMLSSDCIPVCLVDTPGVNSALNRNHAKITRECLRKESYDKVICLLNANKIGSDEEIRHLKWCLENIPMEKVIFVVNKLDDFHASDDSIRDSLAGIKKDLTKIGFQDPIICPLSAYFALLIKMKMCGQDLSADEQDEYAYYCKKYSVEKYDLSIYGKNANGKEDDTELIAMSKKCGLFFLENVLYGG